MNCQNIKIFDTDFSNKYLVIVDGKNIFYCEETMKDILTLMSSEQDISDIVKIINDKYNCNYTENQVLSSLENFNQKQPKQTAFKHIFSIYNSKKIKLKIISSILSNKYYFYGLLVLFTIINLLFVLQTPTSILKFSNQIYAFIILLFIFIGHEFGHSIIAQGFKINTGKIGFGFYLFLPVFYIKLIEIWRLSKNKRVMINLGGMFFQLLLGFIFILIYYLCNEPNIIPYIIKMNMLVILVNLNPFIKLDGYWILADFLDNKNLYNCSREVVKCWRLGKPNPHSKFITIYTIGRLLFWVYVFYVFIRFIVNLILLWI
jgi:putative peptide zinc metalloprotease protein